MTRVHPGEFIAEELEARHLSVESLCAPLSLELAVVEALLAGRRKVTVSTAEGLSRYFGTSVMVWLNLQKQYDHQ